VSAPEPTARGRLAELGRFLEIQNLGLNLPFAVAFLLVAAGGWPTARTAALVLVAFVAARNAGHAFNRWADRRLDALNPRTRDRALVTGRYAPSTALGIALGMGALLVVASIFLNRLTLILAPVALLLLFAYSATKSRTAGTTAYLGLVEAITPAAVYIAVQGTLPLIALPAVGGVLLLGTAFETIHSLGDLDADRTAGLKSLPLALGTDRTLLLLPALHVASLALFAVYAYGAGLGVPGLAAVAAMAGVVAVIDRSMARHPTSTLVPFRLHFLLGLLFLSGVVAAIGIGLR